MTPVKCQLINVGVGSTIPFITFRGEIYTTPDASGGTALGNIVFNGEPIDPEVRTCNSPTPGVVIVEQNDSDEVPMYNDGANTFMKVVGDTAGIEWQLEEGM